MYHSEREDWWEKLHSNQYLWAGDVLSPIQVLLRAMAALHWYPCTSLFPHGLAMIYPVPKGWPATGGVQLFSVGFAAIATLCSSPWLPDRVNNDVPTATSLSTCHMQRRCRCVVRCLGRFVALLPTWDSSSTAGQCSLPAVLAFSLHGGAADGGVD